MKDIKSQFTNVLNHYSKFNQFEFLFVQNKREKTVVTGYGSKKNIMIITDMPEDENFSRKVCLSDLAFLKRILEMDVIKADTGKIDFVPGLDLEGNDILESLLFTAPKISVSYATTDPKVVESDRNKRPPNRVEAAWVTQIALLPDHQKAFQEAYMLQKMMAKKEEDRITKFFYENGNLIAELPYTRSEKVRITLVEGVEEFKIKATYNSDIFSTMLSVMVDDGGGELFLSDTMLRIDTTSQDTEFKMYTPPAG